MKLKTKLLLGFGLLFLVLLIVSSFGIDQTSGFKSNVDDIYNKQYKKVKTVYAIRREINDAAKYIANLLQVTDFNGNQDIANTNDTLDRSSRMITQMQQETAKLRENDLVNAVAQDQAQFVEYKKKLFELLADGNQAAAINLRFNVGLPIQNKILDDVDKLTRYFESEMDTVVADSYSQSDMMLRFMIVITSLGLLIGIGIMLWILYGITRGINSLQRMIAITARGNYEAAAAYEITSRDEIGQVSRAFADLSERLNQNMLREEQYKNESEEQFWLESNLAQLTTVMQGINEPELLAQLFMSEFTPVLRASCGAFYITDQYGEGRQLELIGSYAHDGSLAATAKFKFGQGLVGQSALDMKQIVMNETPPAYVRIQSGLGDTEPRQLLIQPIVFEDHTVAMIELASFYEFTPLELELLNKLSYSLGITINNMLGRMRVEDLLRESQSLAEELQSQSEELMTQQEELKHFNEQLEEQTKALTLSEKLLQNKQDETERINEELRLKTLELEEKVQESELKNEQIEKSKALLEQQTLQLVLTTKYKSEFLANMSHELRTPLNSLLILSQLLSENKDGNLTPKQVEFADTIHSSGSDLLKLIDEVLDLSKIDAGKMQIHSEHVSMEDFKSAMLKTFMPLANQRKLLFDVCVSDEVPCGLYTDGQRLKQIIRNFLSNAFKFTSDGSVLLSVKIAHQRPSALANAGRLFAFSVEDTGIGIASDKQELIFEAFHQGDGSTSRKYGGTGLGLSISRELARLLGGAIELESVVGQGTKFTLYIPELPRSGEELLLLETAATAYPNEPISASEIVIVPQPMDTEAILHDEHDTDDDRNDLQPGDNVILIIEDDVRFAKLMLEMARKRSFKGVIACEGDKGLILARHLKPDAIILDIQLPVLDGWSIMSSLKQDPELRHIPVHMISVIDEPLQGRSMGAVDFLQKPIDKEQLEGVFSSIESFLSGGLKRLLIVENDETQRKSLIELIHHHDVAITAVSSGEEALQELQQQGFDCMVLDLGLAGMSGFDLLERLNEDEACRDLPVIVYTGRELEKQDELRLKKYADSIIIKDVKSPERLLDETALFLHRVEADLPEDKRNMLRKLHNKESVFENKSILLVDDDIRNIFAISSVLEGYSINLSFAENGREALELLEGNPGFDLILMDVMMPEMDGYEAMKAIRSNERIRHIPIIALTAKAMKSDRDKCIEAGASDYVAKPIKTDQLLSLMRVWLYR